MREMAHTGLLRRDEDSGAQATRVRSCVKARNEAGPGLQEKYVKQIKCVLEAKAPIVEALSIYLLPLQATGVARNKKLPPRYSLPTNGCKTNAKLQF